jgi:hypothetical protein
MPTPPIKGNNFGGMIPIVDTQLLPPPNAEYASDCWLVDGRIEPFVSYTSIHTLVNPNARYAFRIPKVNTSVANMADAWWIEFASDDIKVVRSPVTGESDPTYYWAGGGAPPGYTSLSRVQAGSPPLVLGIPAPEVAPGLSATGGVSTVNETRTYVYTWISSYGEESQPSAPSVPVTAPNDATWNLTFTAPTSADTTNRTLTTTRIYRTVTSAQGIATYQFVADLPIATLAYADTIPTSTVALNNQLPSTNWNQPPTDLLGIVPMPNGMLLGWRANEIWFCEPYRPHTWPSIYTVGVESPIIGIAVWGQTGIVLCEGQPYSVTGINPSQMVLAKIQPLDPAFYRGSIVATPTGIIYASLNGLIEVTPYGGMNVTHRLIAKTQFSEMLNIYHLHAAWFNNSYISFAGVSDGVFQEDTYQNQNTDPAHPAFEVYDATGSRDGSLINFLDQRLGFIWLTHPTLTYNVMQDEWTGEVLLIRDGTVVHLDVSQYQPQVSYRWRSRDYQLNFRENWGAAKVFYNQPAGGAGLVTAPTVFRWFCDGEKKFEQELPESGTVMRLPSGFKSYTVQYELEGQLSILNVQLGKSPRDLRGV